LCRLSLLPRWRWANSEGGKPTWRLKATLKVLAEL
jgi:hypothetical protein